MPLNVLIYVYDVHVPIGYISYSHEVLCILLSYTIGYTSCLILFTYFVLFLNLLTKILCY